VDGVKWVRNLTRALRIPPLRSYGITRDDTPGIIAAAQNASSMKANPIALTVEELTEVLSNAN
jgi:alcohol dehydrogenase class IV